MRAINVFLAFTVSALIAFAFFEGGLRLLTPYKPQETINQFDSKLGWSKTPGKAVERSTAEFDITFEINALGLRDDPMEDTRKPDGVFRTVMLGDSFVLGFTVDRRDLFVDHLERWWGEEGRSVEVLNAGTEGWSTDQEVLWFLEHGVDFQPDLVCIFPYENDIYWAGQSDYYGKAKPRFQPDGTLETGTLADRSQKPSALANLATTQFLKTAVLPLLRGGGAGPTPYNFEAAPGIYVPREFGPLVVPPPAFVAQAVGHTRGALIALRDRCNQVGAELLMVPIPSESVFHPEEREKFRTHPAGLNGLDDESWSPNAPVDTFLELGSELGIATLDLRPALERRTADLGRPLYFDEEWHFNPDGNHAIALALHETFDQRGLFPDSHRARVATSLTLPDHESRRPLWPFVYMGLLLLLGTSYVLTYRDENVPLVYLKVGGLLAVVFALIMGGGALIESLPPQVAGWILPGLVLVLLGVIGWKLGRRLGTILELMKAFTLRGHWYLMPLVVVLLTIGSLLVVAASSPLIAPFIYTLF